MVEPRASAIRIADGCGRINIQQQLELMFWTGRLAVTEEALRKAVAEVGDEVDAVAVHLGVGAGHGD